MFIFSWTFEVRLPTTYQTKIHFSYQSLNRPKVRIKLVFFSLNSNIYQYPFFLIILCRLIFKGTIRYYEYFLFPLSLTLTSSQISSLWISCKNSTRPISCLVSKSVKEGKKEEKREQLIPNLNDHFVLLPGDDNDTLFHYFNTTHLPTFPPGRKKELKT